MSEKLTIVDVEGDVPAAVARIERALHRLRVTLFATIDHAAGRVRRAWSSRTRSCSSSATQPWAPR